MLSTICDVQQHGPGLKKGGGGGGTGPFSTGSGSGLGTISGFGAGGGHCAALDTELPFVMELTLIFAMGNTRMRYY